MQSDAELTRAWARGDERAGYALYRRHAGVVVRFLRNKVAASDLDDLLQSTFMKCFEHADRLTDEASFRAFLLGFARNVLLHHYRSIGRKHGRIDFGVTSVCALGVSPSGAFAHGQQQQQLLTALRALAIEHQILLELFYWENMGGPELAELYETAEGTIRTRLRRARTLLAEALRALESPGAQIDVTDMGIETWARNVRAQMDRSGDDARSN